MLWGSGKDSISASVEHGPIMRISEMLLQKKFLLSRYTRSCRAREYYYNQRNQQVRRQDQLPTLSIAIVKNNSKRFRQRPVYKNRGLPNLASRSVEAKRVHEWIQSAIKMGALRMKESRTAFKVFEDVCAQNRDTRKCLMYQLNEKESRRVEHSEQHSRSMSGVPSEDAVRATPGVAQSLIRSVETEVRTLERVLDDDTRTSAEVLGENNREPNNDVDVQSPGRLPLPSRADLNSSMLYIGEGGLSNEVDMESESFAQQVDRMKETAKDDKKYFLLCEIERAEDGNCLHLACAAAIFLRELKSQGLACEPILEDMLQFAIEKHFGTTDIRAQEARRVRIGHNVRVLNVARSVLKLSAFERMSWEGLRQPNTTFASRPELGSSSPGGFTLSELP